MSEGFFELLIRHLKGSVRRIFIKIQAYAYFDKGRLEFNNLFSADTVHFITIMIYREKGNKKKEKEKKEKKKQVRT
jgi:hypothetical protein